MNQTWMTYAVTLALLACGGAKFSSSTAVPPKKTPPVAPEVSNNNETNAEDQGGTAGTRPASESRPEPTVFGEKDDNVSQGAVGNVYNLIGIKASIWDGKRTGFFPALPDFSPLTPVGKILARQFDLPKTSFLTGFPGIDPSLKEYFGIAFSGKLVVPVTGTYEISLAADDGAIFAVDGKVVLDADGVHTHIEKKGTVAFTAGTFPFTLNYMQMPRTEVGLTLKWKLPGSSELVVIPSSAILRP